MATHITGTTEEGRYEEWSEDGEEYNPLYFDCEVALRQYTMEADAYGDIEFWFYRSYETCDAEDGWPVVYSDTNGKPSQLLVSITRMRVGLLTGEIGHWAHCTLHLTRPLRRNEKVWIGIWSIFYTTTFDILNKIRPTATDHLWTYALGTYRDDLEDPPPAQAPSEWLKDDWRPIALLPHYFVYSDESPYRDYVRNVSDTIGMTALFGRKYRSFLKQVTANIHATGTAKKHGRFRRYAADSFTLTDSTTKRRGLRLILTAVVHTAESFMKRLRMVKEVQDSLDARESTRKRRRLSKAVMASLRATDRRTTRRQLHKVAFSVIDENDRREFFWGLFKRSCSVVDVNDMPGTWSKFIRKAYSDVGSADKGKTRLSLLKKTCSAAGVTERFLAQLRILKKASSAVNTEDGKRTFRSLLKNASSAVYANDSREFFQGFLKRAFSVVDATESREIWRRLIKRVSSVVDADDMPGTWRTLLLKKATVAFVFAAFTIMKTLNCLIHEVLALAGRIKAGRVIARFVDTAATFWERLVRRRFTNRLGMEFWSPVTTELTLKSIIQEDRT